VGLAQVVSTHGSLVMASIRYSARPPQRLEVVAFVLVFIVRWLLQVPGGTTAT
jgi:hypothetical protein